MDTSGINKRNFPQIPVQVTPNTRNDSSVSSLSPVPIPPAPPGDIKPDGAAVTQEEPVKRGQGAPGVDNQAAIKEMCNAQVNNVGDFVNVCAASGLIDAAQAQEYQAAIDQINNTLQTPPITSDNARSAMNALVGVYDSVMNDYVGGIDQVRQSGLLPKEAEQVLDTQIGQIQDAFQAFQVQTYGVLLMAKSAEITRSDIQNSNIDARVTKQLEADAVKCLTSNKKEDIDQLAKTLDNIMANGLPEDQGSLNDIMTALMIMQLKYAMEGKKANREMSAEMAATIYQNAMKIAENTLKSGEIAFKQAIADAVTSLVGTALQSGAVIGGNIAARQKTDKMTDNLSGTLDVSKQHRHSAGMQGAIIQTTTAAGQAGAGLMTTIKTGMDASAEYQKNKLQGENQTIEALNRLNENVQQGIRDVAESFNSLIKMTLQMMQSINSLIHEGTAKVTG